MSSVRTANILALENQKKVINKNIAYLVFSGSKHDDFPDADELVAIVYDGAYDELEVYNFAV